MGNFLRGRNKARPVPRDIEPRRKNARGQRADNCNCDLLVAGRGDSLPPKTRRTVGRIGNSGYIWQKEKKINFFILICGFQSVCDTCLSLSKKKVQRDRERINEKVVSESNVSSLCVRRPISSKQFTFSTAKQLKIIRLSGAEAQKEVVHRRDKYEITYIVLAKGTSHS